MKSTINTRVKAVAIAVLAAGLIVVSALFGLQLNKNQELTITNQELAETLEAMQQGDVIMRLAIFPSGAEESYLFEIRQDGTMFCQLGVRRNDDIQSKEFYKTVSEQDELTLEDEDFQSIVALAEELRSGDVLFEGMPYTDSWTVVLSYNGKVLRTDYWNNPSGPYRILVNKVIKLSPIPVDIHEWA